MHETTAKAKALVNAYYGNTPRFSYFQGCSAGGRQGLKSAQKFPEDFDGIVAGAPALNTTGRAIFAVYAAQALRKEEGSYIPATKYQAIHRAVLEACDAKDGVKDDVLENPRACTWDPKVIECKAGTDDASCLTPAQVVAARALYQPVKNSRTGKLIFSGLELGSEMGWSTFGSQQAFPIATQMFQQMVFKNPAWDYKTLNYDSDIAAVDSIEKGNINAMDPNLKPFIARGGQADSVPRLGGSADPVRHQPRVLHQRDPGAGRGRQGEGQLPAVHGAGDGPLWRRRRHGVVRHADRTRAVGREKAPRRTRFRPRRIVDGRADRTRPLCPYPQVASYKGSGSPDEASSFVCK